MLPSILVPLALGLATPGASRPAAAARAAADTVQAVAADQPVVITFDNQGFEIATIYAVSQSGFAVRLGQVSPGASRRLVLPRSVAAVSVVK